MTISMYQASLPSFIRMLRNLSDILQKGSAFAQQRELDAALLVQTRLYPDMLPLAQHVQIATDMVKGCAARLADMSPPVYEDNETTIPQLQARIGKTIDYLESFRPEQLEGSETRSITIPLRNGPLTMDGRPYLLDFVIPNFYFHVTTTYLILRHCGVNLGKADFLASR
ncbi:DUF1993 domain-containing protein [Allohahella sp. A8]|uniref:DUF1993 domain-containing protein n=1 Tax=Allohahella sp. A8 TaxID=3141461 RepID=UPI003A7FFE21